MKKVAVIGCGPAGLLVAHAARLHGHAVDVYTPDAKKSSQPGAQYIHSEIPELPMLPGFQDQDIIPFKLRYHRLGSEEVYAQKIYQDKIPSSGTSWSKFRPFEMAWPMQEVYEALYESFKVHMVLDTVTPNSVHFLLEEYDYVMNTAPLHSLAPMGEFFSEKVAILTGKSEPGVSMNEIFYYGDDRPAYRSSNIKGYRSIEYPIRSLDAVSWRHRKKLSIVYKPLSCIVHLPGVFRLGRYGKWQKGILVDQAFQEAMLIFEKRLSWEATLPG